MEATLETTLVGTSLSSAGVPTVRKVRSGMMKDLDDSVFWTGPEVERLIEAWSVHADEVNNTRNEGAMQAIADHIGTGKTNKQVRAKLKKMRCRYIQEKEKVEMGKGHSKWRFFKLLDVINIVKNPHRRPGGILIEPATTTKKKLKDLDLFGAACRATPGFSIQSLYPYDPQVPENVVIDSVWSNWNATLPFAMTDSGLRRLMRAGFRDISHLELLKGKTASVDMLGLNYHDKLALEYALEADSSQNVAPQYQVITNDDGTVIEVRANGDGSVTAEEQKLYEWNRQHTPSLSEAAIQIIIKAGFTSPAEVTELLDDETLEELDLTPRDRALLKRIAENSTS